MSNVPVTVLGGAVDGTIRHAKRRGRDHLVVPVVALIGDTVLRPLNSRGPEFIPASVLTGIAKTLNGRPVVHRHPQSFDGTALTANDPSTDESHTYGTVYGARYENGKLKAELWVDPQRANEIGAGDVITRFESGELVEVSVGALVSAVHQPNVSPTGAPYEWRWESALGDHLATLDKGEPGACSVAMGCGAPRVLSAASEQETLVVSTTTTRRLNAWGRLMTQLQEMFPDNADAIVEAIRNIAPTVVEQQSNDGNETTNSNTGDETAITPVETPVAAASPIPVDGTASNPASTDGGAPAKEETCMCQVKDLAGRLIANERVPYEESDRATLEALGETKLMKLIALADGDGGGSPTPTPGPQNPPTPSPGPTPSPTPTPTPTPSGVADDAPKVTKEEMLAAYPEIKQIVDAYTAQQEATVLALATAIAPKSNGAYTVDVLKTKQPDELRSLARALGLDKAPVDHSLIGLAVAPAAPAARKPIPDPYNLNATKAS